jgi:uncharacterized membrane protein
METKTAMGCTNIWTPIQEIQFEATNAILVNLVDINVLMLLWANLSRHLDRCTLRMLRRDISCHLLVSRVQPHAVLDTIKHPPVNHPVMLLMQATMFLAQPKRARLLVLLEPIKQAQDNPRVTMLMQATMFLAQPKRARLLVLQEPTTRIQVPHGQWSALNPLSDITFQHPANRARPLVR